MQTTGEVKAHCRFVGEGDGYSHLPDPVFVARAGDTNHVVLLLGKPYDIHCNMPIQVVGKEGVEVEVSEADGNLGVVWPVRTTNFLGRNPFLASFFACYSRFSVTYP